MASIVDLENFAWWTEVRDTKSLEPLAFRQRWSDRRNSFTAPLSVTGGNSLTRQTARAATASAPAARNAFGPKSRPPRKRLAFPNAWSDSRNSRTARLPVTRGDFLARQTPRATTGAPAAARNNVRGPKSGTSILDLDNFACWTEVRDVFTCWTEVHGADRSP